MKKFVIMYDRGPSWDRTKTVFEQNLFAHGNYMAKLFKKGKIEAGGPFYDDQGSMVILNVETEDEAREILAHDPAVKQKIYVGKIRAWMAIDWENY